ncbi:MAG TPA: efflux RND transporter periplasmic adaptor subunit [Fimbriimonadaceae bacterium]|nr:efflux RND transporter periplasmic adaptor subunit [Fimbriimonadaceae bacterium]
MKKWLAWGIPAVIVVALVAWRFYVRAGTEGATSRTQGMRRGAAAMVEVAPAGSRVIVQQIESVGDVEAPFKVEISPKSAGRINFLQVREGDPVKAGQVILKIDPSDLQGAVVQAEANVAEARSRLAQAKITQNATDIGVTSQIKQQKAGVTSAQADLEQVKRNYESQVQQAQAQANAAQAAVENAQKALDKENANLNNAQIKYDRTVSIYKQGFIAAQDVDDAKTALEVEKGAVGVAQAVLASAKSQFNAQQQNLQIVKRKGISDIADSQAKASQANATLEVAKANRSQTPAYKENIAALQSAVDAAIAGLNQAKAKLADTVIRSSITGTVTARKADPGALASPGSPVLEVQFLDWVYVTTSIPVDSSGSIHQGQMADIQFDALPGRTFRGTITNLNPAADPQSRQFSLSVRLNNPDHILRPGMYARVTIEIGRVKAAVVVPREALKTNPDGSTTVTVVDDKNIAHVRTVKLGVSDDKGDQILEGVQPGEKVVILTYSPLKDGQQVTMGSPGGASGKGSGGRSGSRRGQGRPGGSGQ